MSLDHARRLVLSLFSSLLILSPSALAAADRVVAGQVVDQSDRALPRAHVTPAPGAAGVFTDQTGRFQFTIPDGEPCRIDVRLAGFAPVSAPCGSASVERPLRIQLAVAPIADAIIVSATRTDAPASQVGASVTVFDEAELERRQLPLVAELLRGTPGAMLVRNGAPGAVTSLFVRGGESDYNKLLIDGIPINEPGGAFYLNHLTTEHLERVEVVRGAYSALFGSDAMASVIQLFTKRPAGGSPRPRASVQFDGGTYGALHAATSVTGVAGAIDYSLGAARAQTDQRVPNSRLESTTLSANLGVSLGPAATLRVIGRGELARVGTPGPTALGRPDLDAFFDRNDGVVGITFDQQVTPSMRQRVTYSLALSNQASTNLVLDPPFFAAFGGRTPLYQSSDFLNDRYSRLRRHHAGYQGDWRLAGGGPAGDQLLTLVADWDGERATLEDRLAGSATAHARDNFGVAAQHQTLWRRVFVTLGGRLERNHNFGAAFTPRAALVVVARESANLLGETRLKVSAGSGIKEPTLLESYSTSPYFLGNPDLQPERSRSLEIGVEQRLAGDRAKLDVAWFDNRFTNIISLRTDFTTFEGQYFNVGVTRARGLELAGDAAPIASVRMRAAYTWLDSEIVESTDPFNPLFAVGAWAFRRPRHSGHAGVGVTMGRATLDLNGVFVGRYVDSDFGLFDPPVVESRGFTTWDARAAVRILRQLTGLVAIDNLANADYSEAFGYQPLGRVVRAGVRVEF